MLKKKNDKKMFETGSKKSNRSEKLKVRDEIIPNEAAGKTTRKMRKLQKMCEESFSSHPKIRSIKPREGYVFKSDYFKKDDGYGSVLTFFHNETGIDNFVPFWGLAMIPNNLTPDVSIHIFDHVKRMTSSWVDDHQVVSERVSKITSDEFGKTGSRKGRGKASKIDSDLEIISKELANGSAYLKVQFKFLITAESLESLDKNILHIEIFYKEFLKNVYVAPYFGQQKDELKNLFSSIDNNIGKGFYFTSDEFAGKYSLVTHGFEDTTGEYIGKMYGDVNSSAIIFDFDRFDSNVVIAGSNKARTLSKADFSEFERGVTLWGSKIDLNSLMHNHKVVDFVFNGADLTKLCPDLSDITSIIPMNKGSINMFEVFGDKEQELTLYSAQMNKIKLIAKLGYVTNESDRSTIEGSLEEVSTSFYIDKNMWVENAEGNRDRLRLVGLPHKEYPRLREYSAYTNQRYDARLNSNVRDDKILEADRVIKFLFRSMLTTNGDLFDCYTTDEVERAKNNQRVIYDFKGLDRRGGGVMMAQFVNVLNFALKDLKTGDVVTLYGAEKMIPEVMSFVENEFKFAKDRGVRFVWIYSDVGSMINHQAMNHFDEADYTVLGKMSGNVVSDYIKSLGERVPDDLLSQLGKIDDVGYYIRRGFDNVLINNDLLLGID